MAFYSILSGHRYAKAGLKQFSLVNYLKGLPLYLDKGWSYAEDHIIYILTAQNLLNKTSNNQFDAVQLASKLLRPFGTQQSVQLNHFLWNYLSLLKSNQISTIEFQFPLIKSNQLRCFYADSYGLSKLSYFATKSNEDAFSNMAKLMFELLSNFNLPKLFSDSETNNNSINYTPAFEPITFEIELNNPLAIPLTLRNLRLGVTNVSNFYKF